ncbi:MAG: rod shape-determining protein RodA, partial [Anaerolineae bacterium]
MRKVNWRHFDVLLLMATALLVGYGVLMISSAVSDSPGLQELPQRQAVYAGIGVGLMLAATLIDYRHLRDFRYPIYILALGLLVMVLVMGEESYGAQRWVNLRFFPIQPAEIAKVLLMIFLASYFDGRQEEITSFRTFFASLLFVMPAVALIMAQPNLSTAISLLVLWGVMAFVAGVRLRYLLGLGMAGAMASPALWALLAEYQRQRILIFLNPSSDSMANYNVWQAMIGIGSGGWLGKGFAMGSQSQLRFLRVRWSDFIFAVIGEELGFVGVLILVLLLLLVVLRLLRSASRARDMMGQLIAAGVGTLILFQSVVNIGMNIGMLPATGVPLPFVSSGGSSLITFLVAEGLVQSVNLRRLKVEYPLA